MILLDPRKVKWIILHCSASHYGSVSLFDEWHKARGWEGIGYHYIITNCYVDYDSWKLKQPEIASDGLVHVGRSEKFRGAHVSGHNWESLGVCLVGLDNFTARQLEAAARLCTQLMERYEYCQGVRGHYEFTTKKTCPNVDMEWFRKYILTNG